MWNGLMTELFWSARMLSTLGPRHRRAMWQLQHPRLRTENVKTRLST